MNHDSLNTSALFGICICCGSIIYGLTVTRASMVIPSAEINRIECPCIHCRVTIFEIWSPSGVFSWWFERLLLGYQQEYFGWHMVDIE